VSFGEKKMIGVMKKFKTASPAVKASMALLFANLILKGLSLISGPIFTRIMPTDQYGIVSTFQSWQSLLAVIVTLNLSQGVFNNGMLEFKENRDQFEFALVVITVVCTGLFLLIFEIFKYVRNAFGHGIHNGFIFFICSSIPVLEWKATL
jgi:O-antigen/teichoic acid export membrane protein